MHTLYPELRSRNQTMLSVTPPHQLFLEECGNPDGIPVVFLHGGPGSGCEPWHRRFFDPEIYRIILFDQRGCGRSTPHAELQGNDTAALVADIEAVREYFGIERWMVFGGSWGSTLALVYAESFPERVTALVLRGIFLCRKRDIHWFYQDGARHLLPDEWAHFEAPIPAADRSDMVSAYYSLLTGDNEIARMAAAKAWSIWEGRASTLLPSRNVVDHFGDPHTALSLARIECHYFMHDSFLEPNQILDRAHRLRGIPGVIVHGRYDMVCPLEQAWLLHDVWPDSELKIIADAGHSASEPGIVDALVEATRTFAQRLA